MFPLFELVFTQPHHIFTFFRFDFSGSVKLILQAYLKRKVQCRWGGECEQEKGPLLQARLPFLARAFYAHLPRNEHINTQTTISIQLLEYAIPPPPCLENPEHFSSYRQIFVKWASPRQLRVFAFV